MDNIRDMKIPASIFLDLSKAFDTLNFNILLCKLKYYGINGISLNLIKSYLINRFQYVQFENSESDSDSDSDSDILFNISMYSIK